MDPTDLAIFVSLLVAVVAAIACVPLERRRRQRMPQTLPYRWGFFIGVATLAWGALVALAGIAIALEDGPQGLVVTLVAAAVWGLPGVGVLRRRRWAWVVATMLTFNPVLWLANWLYGANRWGEFAASHSACGVVAAAGVSGGIASRRSIAGWSAGRMLTTAGACFGTMVLLLAVTLAYEDSMPRSAGIPIILGWVMLGGGLITIVSRWAVAHNHRGWHGAKLVLLWVLLSILVGVGRVAVEDYDVYPLWYVLTAPAVLAQLVLTWTWLTARERLATDPVSG